MIIIATGSRYLISARHYCFNPFRVGNYSDHDTNRERIYIVFDTRKHLPIETNSATSCRNVTRSSFLFQRRTQLDFTYDRLTIRISTQNILHARGLFRVKILKYTINLFCVLV